VTPPALHKISGRNWIPFESNIFSPSIVVGPLAASTINFDWNFAALLLLIVFSNAAGIKISLD